MNNISRRKFVKAGLATTAGLSGLGIAAKLAQRYGIVPPDSGGIWPGRDFDLCRTSNFGRDSPRPRASSQHDLERRYRLDRCFRR